MDDSKSVKLHNWTIKSKDVRLYINQDDDQVVATPFAMNGNIETSVVAKITGGYESVSVMNLDSKYYLDIDSSNKAVVVVEKK